MKQKFLFITLLMLIWSSAKGQERIYYDAEGKKTNDIASAIEFKITEKSSIDTDTIFKITTYYMSGQKKSENSLLKTFKNQKLINQKNIGERWEWFENGNVLLKASYVGNQLQGEFCTFWPNGVHKRKDMYENGKLIEGTCYDSTGHKIQKYYPYETMPQFAGGEEKLVCFLNSNTHYPVEGLRNGIQGRVILQFFVEADGKLSDIKVARRVHNLLDAEALRVVTSMPDWIPGTLDGQKVRKKYTLPVSFILK